MAEWIIGGLMLGGTILQATQQKKRGQEERALYQQRAAVAEEEAEAVTKTTEHAEREKRKEGRRYLARQKVLFAKSGVKPKTGTPSLVMKETAEEFSKDAAFIQEGGEVETQRLRSEAGLERQMGVSAYRAGLWGARSTVMSGLGTLGMRGYELGWWGRKKRV